MFYLFTAYYLRELKLPTLVFNKEQYSPIAGGYCILYCIFFRVTTPFNIVLGDLLSFEVTVTSVHLGLGHV